jgi:hypothetical protein
VFAGAIVAGGQDQSYLLECTYIFLLIPFVSLVAKDDNEL